MQCADCKVYDTAIEVTRFLHEPGEKMAFLLSI